MSQNENKSQHEDRLQQLLQASPEQLTQWDDGEDWLPDPKVCQRENNLVQALWNDPTLAQEEPSQTTDPAGWLAWLRPMVMGPLLAGVAVLAVLWVAPWQETFSPKNVLIGKGTPQASKHKTVALHLGLWKGKKTKPQRLAHRDMVSSRDSILFGFSLRKTAGYLYLLLQQNNRTPDLIFPMPKTEAPKWKIGFSLLRTGKQLSTYQLAEHSGRVQFVLVKTANKLTPKQQKALTQKTKVLQHLQTLQHKWRGSNRMDFDSVMLHVKVKP
ncbi:MAG: hypothetical protein EP343_09325 [Deltaproteobacteria bacterium]|nr:MAG: hypothetical protein EP343_09325 [Deltaproteobacteria bacterium]